MNKIRPIQDKVQEPLMAVSPQDGFGYYGTLLYDEVEDKIQCHVCGMWTGALSAPHLKIHGLTAREYKQKFELNLTTALQTPSISEKRRRSATENFKKQFGKMSSADFDKKIMRSIVTKSAQARKGKRGNRWTVEMMNRFGTCPKQLEEKFVVALEKIGHTPSATEMYNYDMNLYNTLCKRFKGYSSVLENFGLKGKRRVVYKNQYSRKIVEEMLMDFVDVHKRLPTALDTKKELPGHDTIKKFFGSFQKAKEWAFNYMLLKYPQESDSYTKSLRKTQLSVFN